MADGRELALAALAALATVSAATAGSGAEARRAIDHPGLVSVASVSNGCGGGPASTDPSFKDEWAFGDWRVSFREACNLHDAAYSGAVVYDPFRRKVIDFRTWTQKEIDDKFLEDMRTLCRRQISGAAPGQEQRLIDARNDCTHGEGRFEPACSLPGYNGIPQVGGNSTIGALFAYKVVRKCGHQFYRERIDLDGHWVSSDSKSSIGEVSITQVGRAIALSWTERSGLCGLGTGTLITLDQNEVIQGDAIVSGFTNGAVVRGSLRILVKDGSITFTDPTPIFKSTLHKSSRSTQAAGPKCAKPKSSPPANACKFPRTWSQTTTEVGSTTWAIAADGKAQESGLGNASGTATLAGSTLTITWTTADGWAGVYRWTLGASCGGAGKLTFTKGPRAGVTLSSSVR